ncbi:V-type ATP synthase subunit A [Candidatus Bathyarchaeota archaeon]|nr:V-type ATP synthase subunit A [Candidatus Bathyarchaeota archaeon]MBS7627312.1 V-type ATP synthase subunit A [Candidatus Bathyarchaeota archaeon]
MPVVGLIQRIVGPLIVAKNMIGARMHELVRLGELGIIGEIIRLERDRAAIQAYEETTGLRPGDKVEGTGKPLSVTLGPGLMGKIYDGVQRPLPGIADKSGSFIERGMSIDPLEMDKKWFFQPLIKAGSKVVGGDILGLVQETPLVLHRILVPPFYEGVVRHIVKEGDYSIREPIAEIETPRGSIQKVYLAQTWPVRVPRPYKVMMPPTIPQSTGQRVIDAFFPICKGGTIMIPGGFGTGKTVMLHQLAKFIEADIVVFVGCGERGNEMADVLESFPKLRDPKSGEPLMARTILIANTSNMPIAAREASVYTGLTMAEYYRDMGYDVALMADSTSRWAEALREISGRLEEMPGEEGYPAYLAARLAEFYSRAGHVITLGSDDRRGSITVIGAVSPPGGDFSEPVTQNTLRIVKVFWALDSSLAHRRHFPAINWLTSYSMYFDQVTESYNKEVGSDWGRIVREAITLLGQEEEVKEVASLLGTEVLAESQRLIVEVARNLRENFLRQSAFHPVDGYCSKEKTFHMLRTILKFYRKARFAIGQEVPLNRIMSLPVIEEMARMKLIPSEEIAKVADEIDKKIDEEINLLVEEQARKKKG